MGVLLKMNKQIKVRHVKEKDFDLLSYSIVKLGAFMFSMFASFMFVGIPYGFLYYSYLFYVPYSTHQFFLLISVFVFALITGYLMKFFDIEDLFDDSYKIVHEEIIK